MNDDGLSECLGTILTIGVLLIVAAGVSIYAMGIANDSITIDNPPKYAYVTADVIDAASAPGVMDADSIKAEFTAAQKSYQNTSRGAYLGTEKVKFFLSDPNGGMHEAMQSLAMKDKTIEPGSIFYYYTLSDDINSQYYITNQYTIISSGTSGLKAFAKGRWNVIIVDDTTKTVMANLDVVIS